MESLWPYFQEKFNLKDQQASQYSPLVLAYIGDAVYDLVIRTMIVYEGNMQVNKMHGRAKKFVSAAAQAQIFFAIEKSLSEEELDIFKRGRNAKSATKAKNASLNDYRIATGFEALIGYLYLKKDFKRLTDIVSEGVFACQETPKNL